MALTQAALAADIANLVVVPERNQSAEQARRDRYECHNWAIEQSGVTPIRTDADAERDEARGRRVEKVVLGAAVGAAIGGLVRGGDHGRRGHNDAADGALGGAILGATAGAVAGRRSAAKAASQPGPDDDYLRALGACLEGRGYSMTEGSAGD